MQPEPSPISVERVVPTPPAPGLSEITITPAVAIRMAAAASGATRSPRKIKPKSATCTGSVLI